MTDPSESKTSSPEDAAPAEAPIPTASIVRPSRMRPSLVWIVPIAALIVGAALIVRTLLQAGPDITITFLSADGLEAGRTEVRFKEVVVGRVMKVALSPDRERVLVSVRLDKSVENLAAADTRFWVVRPRVSLAGISGLGTLFSGAYIGLDAGISDESERHFKGLETPPFVLRGEPGRSFLLTARDLGSLDIGSPIYYRRTRVGRVVGYTLDATRDQLTVQALIEKPYEKLVTQNSRFWNASGIDLTLDANGLSVNTESVVSMLGGGLAFANPPDAAPAPLAEEGHRFAIFNTRKAALAPPDGAPVRVRMVFDKAQRGLVVGAPVDMLGVDIGTVRSVSLQFDTQARRLPVEVVAEIFPPRLGSVRRQFTVAPADAARTDQIFLKRLVDNGLRAQVRTGNLLTGQLYVALDFIPKAPKATLDEHATVVTIPSVPGTLSDLQPQLAEIVSRISKIKFDEIGTELQGTLKSAGSAGDGLRETLASANAAIKQLSPEAQRALAEVQKTLSSAQSTLASFEQNISQSDAPLQRNAIAAMAEIQRAAQALRVLSDYLQQHPESILRGKPADPDVTKPAGGTR